MRRRQARACAASAQQCTNEGRHPVGQTAHVRCDRMRVNLLRSPDSRHVDQAKRTHGDNSLNDELRNAFDVSCDPRACGRSAVSIRIRGDRTDTFRPEPATHKRCAHAPSLAEAVDRIGRRDEAVCHAKSCRVAHSRALDIFILTGGLPAFYQTGPRIFPASVIDAPSHGGIAPTNADSIAQVRKKGLRHSRSPSLNGVRPPRRPH